MTDKIKIIGYNVEYTQEELKERQKLGYSIPINII